MISRVIANHPKGAEQCVSTHHDPEFHIYDPPLSPPDAEGKVKRQPCTRREGAPQPNDFAVGNQTAQPVHLVAIDACLYDSGDATRCDCALIQAEDIRFVEFSHGNFRRRSQRVEKCIPQLAATINDFYQYGIITEGTVVQAFICVGFTDEFPPQNASLDARKAQLNLLVKANVAVELYVTDQTIFTDGVVESHS
ncbi:hypothetical protein Q5H93_09910 [Hymenobacter sp. ASUV-10]|uniref:Uncharacterized protein n=1 Tax=Hymenobacter aranciens TaxID=3063996 RepID=A0ABT9B9V2_9BACT|nr:hypothetical protein [Hymenobacter sp. ASUV-10]MDO7875044.1 hypothetical protein [Hymenobacter sp. ASUV-10]